MQKVLVKSCLSEQEERRLPLDIPENDFSVPLEDNGSKEEHLSEKRTEAKREEEKVERHIQVPKIIDDEDFEIEVDELEILSDQESQELSQNVQYSNEQFHSDSQIQIQEQKFQGEINQEAVITPQPKAAHPNITLEQNYSFNQEDYADSNPVSREGETLLAMSLFEPKTFVQKRLSDSKDLEIHQEEMKNTLFSKEEIGHPSKNFQLSSSVIFQHNSQKDFNSMQSQFREHQIEALKAQLEFYEGQLAHKEQERIRCNEQIQRERNELKEMKAKVDEEREKRTIVNFLWRIEHERVMLLNRAMFKKLTSTY